MAVKYEKLTLVWLNQLGGNGTTVTWTFPSEGDLGTLNSGSTISIPLSARVINGPPAEFTILSGTIPDGLTISGSTLSGNPDNLAASYNFTLRASSNGAHDDRSFSANVAVTLEPVWTTNSGSIGSAYETTTFSTTLIATDPQNLPITYSLIAGTLPQQLSFNTNTGVLSGKLSVVGGDTTYSFTISANNGIKTKTRGFNFTTKANAAPEWVTSGIGMFDAFTYLLDDIYESTSINYSLEATNLENDQNITYSFVGGNLPYGVTFTGGNSATISGTMSEVIPTREFVFSVRASDGLKYSDRAFALRVRHDSNPVWQSSGNLAIGGSGTYVSVTVSAYDVNSKTITYSVDPTSTLPGTLVFYSANATLAGNLPYSNTGIGTYTFNLVANNGTLATTRSFSVQAQPYVAPTWETAAGSLGTGYEGAAFSKTVKATGFGGGTITYSANAAQLPSGFSINPNSGTISGTFGTISDDTTYTFDVIAIDSINSVSRSFSISEYKNTYPIWNTNAVVLIDTVSGYAEEITLSAYDLHNQAISYSITSGSLPSALTMTLGKISGTLGVTGTDSTANFTVAATNTNGLATDRTFSIISRANLPPVWVSNGGLIGTYNEQSSVTYTFQANDPENKTLSFTATGDVPSGVSVSSSGTLSGILPAILANTAYNFTVSVSDGTTNQSSKSFSIDSRVVSPPAWQTASALANAVEQISSTYYLVADGATSYSLTSGSVPSGMTFYSNGAIIGIPDTTSGDTSYTFAVTATNGVRSSDRTFTLPIRDDLPPTWNTAAGEIANAIGHTELSVQISATDRNGLSLTYALSNGTTLPSGLSLSSSGLLTGRMPIVANATNYSFTVSADNQQGLTSKGYRTFIIHAQADTVPVWSTASGSIGSGMEGTAFSKTVIATDPEENPLTFTVSNGTSLPGNLTLTVLPSYATGGIVIKGSNTVTISGTLPAVSADTTYNFTLAAYDGRNTAYRAFSINVTDHISPVWDTTSGSLGTGFSGEGFSYTLEATSPNDLPLTFTVNSGTFPSTMSLGTNGQISGNEPIVVANTTYNFVVTVSDGTFSVNRAFSISNKPNAAPVWVTSNASPLVNQIESTSFSTTFLATDPENLGVSYTFGNHNFPTQNNGSPIFSLGETSGVLSGTFPAVLTDTTYTFTIIASDRQGVNSTSKTFTMINKFGQVPTWVTTSGTILRGTQETSATITVQATAGAETITYSVVGSSLPSGFSLNANTGAISGTFPVVIEDTDYPFTIRAAGTAKYTDRDFVIRSLIVRPPVWTTAAGNVYTNFAGNTLSVQVAATSPNDLPLTYILGSNNLPVSVTFDANTQIVSGTLPYVTANTTYSLSVQAYDGSIGVSRTFTILNKYNPAPTWISNSIANAVENVGYSYQMVATNTYSDTVIYTLSNGTSLPTGLSMSQGGLISGKIANAVSDYTVPLVFAANNGFFSNYTSLTMTVNHDDGPVWVSNASLSGREQTLFSTVLVANNSLGLSITYSNSTAIGNNLTLLSNGLLYGVVPAVTSNTSVNFDVVATDAAGKSATQTFTFVDLFDAVPVWTSNSALGNFIENTAVSIQFTVSDEYPLIYTLNSGTLPAGLSLSNSGLLSGTTAYVLSNTTATFSVRASDNLKYSDQSFTFTTLYDPPPVFTTTSLPVGYEGFAYSQAIVSTSEWSLPITYSTYVDAYAANTIVLVPMTGTAGSQPVDTTGDTITQNGSGAPISSAQSKFSGSSAQFSGGSFLYVNKSANLNGDFTVEAWIYPTNITTGIIWGSYTSDAGGTDTLFWMTGGTLTYGGNGFTIVSGGAPTINQWNHVALTRSGTTHKIFINGTQTGSGTGAVVSPGSLTNKWGIGGYESSPGYYTFQGYMNDFRITKGISRYNASFAVPTYSYSPSVLPDGVTFNSNGLVSGTLPIVNATTYYTITADAYDTIKHSYKTFNIIDTDIVAPVWANTNIGSFDYAISNTISVQLSASTNRPNGTVTYSATELPSGFALASNGLLTASLPIPNAATQVFTFNAIATDGTLSNAQTISLTETFADPAITWTDNTSVSAYELSTYSYQFTANNGNLLTYTLNSGTLPSTLTLTNTGLLSGTLTAIGANSAVSTFAVKAADGYYRSSVLNFTFTKQSAAPVWVTATNIGSFESANAISISVSATSPRANTTVTYSVVSGSLPSGVTLSNAGLISGTLGLVSSTTIYSFDLAATDGTFTTTKSFTLTSTASTTYALGDPYYGSTASLLRGDGIGGSIYQNDISGAYPVLPTGSQGSNFTFAGDFTIEAWVYYTSASGTDSSVYAASQDGTTNYFAFNINMSTNAYSVYLNGGATSIGSHGISANTWTHVALVRSGSTITAYTNGVSKGTVTNSSTLGYSTLTAHRIGTGAATRYITNFRMVKSAVYTANFTPPISSALTAISNTVILLNAASSSTLLTDSSANNYTVTASGTPTWSVSSPYTFAESASTTVKWFTAGGVNSSAVSKFGTGSMYFPGGTASSTMYARSTTDTRYNLSGNTDFTVEMWANTTSFPVGGADCLWNVGQASAGNTAHNLDFYLNGNATVITAINFNAYNISGTATIIQTFTLPTPLALNTWHHYVLERNNYTYYVYVDGLLVGSYYNATSLNYQVGDYMQLGSLFITNYASPFNGYIDDFRFTAGVARYNGNFSVPTAAFPSVTSPIWTTQAGLLGYNYAGANSAISNVSVVTTNPHTGSIAFNGSSLSNGGSNQYLTAPANAGYSFGTGDFTVEAWVYPRSFDAAYGKMVFDSRPAATNGAYWYMGVDTTGKVNFGGGAIGAITDTIAMSLNTWYHVAATRQGTAIKLFVNGRLAGTATSAGTADSSGIFIGVNAFSATATNSYWHGYMSNIRIVKGTAVYTAAFTAPTLPVSAIANTSLLLNATTSGTLLTDSSNNALTITNVNRATWSSVAPFTYPVTYALNNGDALPATLTLDSNTGTISGTLSTVATETTTTFTVYSKDVSTYTQTPQVLKYSAVTDTDPYYTSVDALVRAKDTTTNATVWNYVLDYSKNKTPFYTANSGVVGFETNAITKFANTASMYFNGTPSSTAIVQAGPSSTIGSLGTSDFTLEAWVYPVRLTSASAVYRGEIMAYTIPGNTATAASGFNWSFFMTGSSATNITGLSFEGYTTGAVYASSTASIAISLNAWHHIAMVRSGTTVTFFVDGIAVAGTSFTAGIAFQSSATATLQLGGLATVASGSIYCANLNGYIQEARISKVARYGASSVSPNGGSLAYNGTSYATAAANTAFEIGSGDFTIEAWIYPTNVSTAIYGPGIIAKGVAGAVGNEAYSFQILGSAAPSGAGTIGWFAAAYNGAASAVVQSPSAVSLNTWTHIAVTRSGTTHRMFINGALVATASASYTVATGGPLSIGTQWYALGVNTRSFTGNITNLRLVKGTALYSASFTPSTTTPLTAVANTSVLFNAKTSATMLTDSSTNNFTMTNSGSTWSASSPLIVPSTAFPVTLGSVLRMNGDTAIADAIVPSRTFTNSGGVTINTGTKKYGAGSMYFNGSQHLTTPNSTDFNLSSNTAWTVEAWVYPTTLATPQNVGTSYETGNHLFMTGTSGSAINWRMQLCGSELGMGFSNNGWGNDYHYKTSGAGIVVNTWQHIAVVRSGSQMKMFVNGVLRATHTPSFGVGNTGVLMIGSYLDGGYKYTGYMDDIRISLGARYTATFTPPSEPLNNG